MTTSYRHSFSSLGCPALTWTELCDLSRKFGIKDLELRALGGELDLPAHLDKQFGTPATWTSAVNEAAVRICGLSTSLKLVGSKPEDRLPFLAFLPWAEAVGGVPLRVFDGGTVEGALDNGGLDEALETIAWWRELRTQNNWQSDIIVETHDALARTGPILQLQAALGDASVDLLWDTHHTWKKGGEAIESTWESIGPWVTHVHVKDSISLPSARHPYTYVLPGDGEFPLLQTLRLLHQAGFNKVVSLEWEKLWHPYLGPIETALNAMSACYQQAENHATVP